MATDTFTLARFHSVLLAGVIYQQQTETNVPRRAEVTSGAWRPNTELSASPGMN
jgi:hypothetical protein